jgi:hypothetical protein
MNIYEVMVNIGLLKFDRSVSLFLSITQSYHPERSQRTRSLKSKETKPIIRRRRIIKHGD